VFALASATTDITTAHPEAVASGTRVTFGGAAILIGFAVATRRRSPTPLAHSHSMVAGGFDEMS